MRLAALALTSLSLVSPALAVDAVTYKGTLGKFDIIAELVASPEGALAGRYSYLGKGGDIPLDAAGTPGAMVEEAPCTETTCIQNDDGVVTDPPIGAHWSLQASADGETLAGTWKAAGKSGKVLDVNLTRIGQRSLPEDTELTPYGIYDSVWQLTYADGFTPEAAPYDFAKMDVALGASPDETIEGSRFHYLTDPRSKFPFPRIVALSDGSSPNLANQELARRHAQINFYAFDCLAQIYAGFGANQYSAGLGPGTLGDFDSELITVSSLTPTAMSWVQSGSTFCGGAHPNNHSDSYNLDVKAGHRLPLAKVFKDWIAISRATDFDNPDPIDQAIAAENPDDYYWSAGQPLIDFAIAHRVHDTDAQFESDCGIDELIGTNLNFRFAPGEAVVFSLEGLPNVVAACGGDLLTVKLETIPELLAPTAVDYFPGLAD
ncbi:hypothetical protein [Devosia aquimaris]|uniref:hypothetical protein n=1 Tax=Devosia aquimaris TaxID=2866214 RepID=UPI001CD1085D|nr:hypothetical protein [Devosia sp. CJK-A8-3]